MTRAPFQVLVLPYRITADGSIRYALLKREPSTGGYWQGIAGGGEDNETPMEAARRETFEEAGIPSGAEFFRLDSVAMIPVECWGFRWGDDVLVIPNHCFGVRVHDEKLTLSDEHTEYQWVSYEDARSMLHWEDNQTALWELNHRLTTRPGSDKKR
jgi:dATP pyrophosphohydrolase